jgi:hypothetical protein
MTQTLEDSNAALRRAVEARLATGTYDEYVELTDTETRTITARTDTESMTENIVAEVSQQAPRGWSAAEVIERFAVPEPRRFYPSTEDLQTEARDVHPTSQAFFDLCDALKEMHRRKSRDYGCPSGDDPLANIRNGAQFVGIPDWKGAMVRLSDKVTRLATYNATGRLDNESLEDNLFDLASYSLLALLLHREEQSGPAR